MKRQLMTSLVFTLVAAPVASAAMLAFDVNSRSASSITVAGFEPWTIDTPSGPVSTATQTLASGYTVRFDVYDDGDPNDSGSAGNNAGAFDDRLRSSPTGTPNYNNLYNDFIFAGASTGPTGGLDMTISGGALAPNTQYVVAIYSFDGINATGGSTYPNRVAKWLDGNNADQLVTMVNFATNVHPTTDDQYRFTGIATTDATGKLFLKGRRVSAESIATDISVYVNGVEVMAIPEPATLVPLCLAVGLALCRRHRG